MIRHESREIGWVRRMGHFLCIIVMFLLTLPLSPCLAQSLRESIDPEAELVYLITLNEAPLMLTQNDKMRWDNAVKNSNMFLPAAAKLMKMSIQRHRWEGITRLCNIIDGMQTQDKYPVLVSAVLSLQEIVLAKADDKVIHRAFEVQEYLIASLDNYRDHRVVELSTRRLKKSPEACEPLVYMAYLRRACIGDETIASKIQEIMNDQKSRIYNDIIAKKCIEIIRAGKPAR